MNILLVLPAPQALRVTSSGQAVPRRALLRFSVLSLTAVAAVTPPQHHVALVDENVQPLDLDAAVDVVGISFMTALAPRAYALADHFRRRGVKVVAGGYHATLCPQEAAAHFDAVVVGDAEGLWPQVLRDLEAGTPQRIYRHEKPIDLATVPVPRRDLTAATARHYVTTHAVQVGRGCQHTCRYCSVTAFHGGVYRTRPLPHVIAELRDLPRNFMFVDDNIIADPQYARALFQHMIPLKKRWISQCSLKIADDPQLLRLARAAGCRGLFIGIETTHSGNLRDMAKSINDPRDYGRRLRAIHRAGIGVQAGIIVGLDHDEVTVFARTLRFLQRHHIDALQLNILTPLPGTPLYDRLAQEGRIIDHDWSHYDFFHTVIQPRRMSATDLQAGAQWLYTQYYRLDRIVGRSLRALFTLGPLPAVLMWKLNLTYRRDLRQSRQSGYDPARRHTQAAPASRGGECALPVG